MQSVHPCPNPCPCPQGSLYDGLADNYNNYGTASRGSYYTKFQAGNGSWGYPVRAASWKVCGLGLGSLREKGVLLTEKVGQGGKGCFDREVSSPPSLTRSICLAIMSWLRL